MKILKQLFLVTLVVCAVNARAQYGINMSAGPLEITSPLLSGQSDYTLTLSGGNDNVFSPNSYTINTYGGPFSSVSFDTALSTLNLVTGGTYNAGTYQLVVDWTIGSAAAVVAAGGYWPSKQYFINLGANNVLQGGVFAGANTTDTIHVTAVPEPMQAVASCMLLGCGVLGFAGRRLLKKQAK
jgi:hypothetical protein